jgi:hypothetical protein
MAEEEGSKKPDIPEAKSAGNGALKDGKAASRADQEEEGEDEDEEEEPRLKYAQISKRLSSLYRNGDAVSAFLVAGDKMVCVHSIRGAAHSNPLLTADTDCWNP